MPNNHCSKCGHNWKGPLTVICPHCKSDGWYESPTRESCGMIAGTCDICGCKFSTGFLQAHYCPNCGSKKWDNGKPELKMRSPNLWIMKKTKHTKRGLRIYTYWMATWRQNGKTRNVHLGSCKNMGIDTAKQKANKLKTDALGMKVL